MAENHITSYSCTIPTNVNALYLVASSQILSKGATFPSIEKTPSVTIILMRAFDDFNLSSKSKVRTKANLSNKNVIGRLGAKCDAMKIIVYTSHVSVQIALLLCFAQTNTIDDRGVIEFV